MWLRAGGINRVGNRTTSKSSNLNQLRTKCKFKHMHIVTEGFVSSKTGNENSTHDDARSGASRILATTSLLTLFLSGCCTFSTTAPAEALSFNLATTHEVTVATDYQETVRFPLELTNTSVGNLCFSRAGVSDTAKLFVTANLMVADAPVKPESITFELDALDNMLVRRGRTISDSSRRALAMNVQLRPGAVPGDMGRMTMYFGIKRQDFGNKAAMVDIGINMIVGEKGEPVKFSETVHYSSMCIQEDSLDNCS